MKTNSYLLDLIDRMNDANVAFDSSQNAYDSSQTIRWKAFRETEKLVNKEFIPQLMTFIENEKEKKKRDRAYFIIAHIAKNTNDNLTAQFLINRIEKETDKYIISSLLDRLADLKKSKETDLTPLINATKCDKWLIRYSAIKAFNNSEGEIAETTLIDILNYTDDPYNLVYASSTLNKIGTLKAIPHLEKHINSRKRDVKNSAKFAIEEINKRYLTQVKHKKLMGD